MITFLRTSVVVSSLALIAVAVIPFDRPHEATIPIDQPLTLPLLASLCGLLIFSLQAISAYALFRFRRWAPKLAAVTAVLVAGFALVLVLAPSLASNVSVAAKAMAFLSAVSLALAVLVTRSPDMKERFGVSGRGDR